MIGIPCEVEADALEEKVVAIFQKLGCSIPTEHIEACHRISKKNFTVTVKFSRRKDCQHVKRDLRKIKIKDIDLPGQKTLFISKSLCLYYKMIWVKSKKLHSLGKIHSLLFRVTQLRSGVAKIVRRCP